MSLISEECHLPLQTYWLAQVLEPDSDSMIGTECIKPAVCPYPVSRVIRWWPKLKACWNGVTDQALLSSEPKHLLQAEELQAKLTYITEKVPTRIMNNAGSNAGAGSGEFHMYRMGREQQPQVNFGVYLGLLYCSCNLWTIERVHT